jgi:hypothetical protein
MRAANMGIDRQLRGAEATAPLAKLLLLTALPLAGAIAGALFDERDHLGFTNWRSACRVSGFSFRSTVTFAFELLPTAIIGLLAGGLALQAIGFRLRHRDQTNLCLTAHAGCALTMPIGMALCAYALPLPTMLAIDVSLAFAAAWLVRRFFLRSDTCTHRGMSVVDRIPSLWRTPENSAVANNTSRHPHELHSRHL